MGLRCKVSNLKGPGTDAPSAPWVMSSLCVVRVEGLVDGWHIDKNIDNLYADYYYYYYYNRDQITKPYTWTVFAFHDSNTGVPTELCVSCVYSCTFWVLVC